MATLQEAVQAAIRTATGTSQTYEGDWQAYCDVFGLPAGNVDERRLACAQVFDSTISTASAAHNFFLYNCPTYLESLSFNAPLRTSTTAYGLGASVAATFTRATTAYVWGYSPTAVSGDSQVLMQVASGEARFQGARRVSQGVYSEFLSDGTAIPQSTLKGYLSESAATQLVTPTAAIRDMTNTWANAGTMTVTKTATGTTGVANSASVLTGGAVAATNRLTLTLVAAATSRTYSCYIKRITGTGPILITQDNFATTTDVSSQLTANQWVLVQLNASVLNAQYGLQVSTQGDVIHVDWNQFEAGGYATSPIDTAGGTRNADQLAYPQSGNLSVTTGTIYAEMSSLWTTLKATNGFVIAVGTGGMLATTSSVSTLIRIYDGTTNVSKTGISSSFYTVRKRAASWGALGMSVTGDGATISNGAFDGDLSGANLSIGSNGAGAQWDGTIKNVRIHNAQLSNATLQYMTT